jgi:hypothetical protein
MALARRSADTQTCDRLRGYGATIFTCDVTAPQTLVGAAAGAAAVVACLGSRKPASGDVYRVDKQVGSAR